MITHKTTIGMCKMVCFVGSRARVGWCPTVCSQGTIVHNHIVSGESNWSARLSRYRLSADAPIGSSYASMQ